MGSTPRMRGIYPATKEEQNRYRFNPAYAGNIINPFYPMGNTQVQPRVCGEYLFPIPSPDFVLGSTPRMRGIYLQNLS